MRPDRRPSVGPTSRWADDQWWLALLACPVGLWLIDQLEGGATAPAWILQAPLVFLSLTLIYPVLEELAFRGLIQDQLTGRLRPWRWRLFSKANVLTSLMFAGLHGFQHAPLWAAAVMLPSLVFGHFRERHASLISPIMLHAFYNGAYFATFGPPL